MNKEKNAELLRELHAEKHPEPAPDPATELIRELRAALLGVSNFHVPPQKPCWCDAEHSGEHAEFCEEATNAIARATAHLGAEAGKEKKHAE